MRAKILQLMASRYGARILLVLVLGLVALAVEPASGANSCAPWRHECP